MKVLINIPSLALPGGVANHYKGLMPFWKISYKYNEIGRRESIPAVIILIYDYLHFLYLLISKRYDVVLLNPSLGKSAILRDSLFLALAKLFKHRVAVFFHGWDATHQNNIELSPQSFMQRFGNADAIIVLAREFDIKLREWGIKAPIYLTTTKVDDRLISKFDITKKQYGKTVLFLSRVESNKGIYIAIDAFSKILVSHPDARLIVAGSGSALNSAIAAAQSMALPNVEFMGNISGEALINAFSVSDIYLLPTTHGEGLPTSVLEAMAFGLPVITRPVGGIKDFFQNSKMGSISETIEPQWYADVVCDLFNKKERMWEIGQFNHAYAKEHFMASKVARQLEGILEKV